MEKGTVPEPETPVLHGSTRKPMFDDKHQKILNGVTLSISKAVGFCQNSLKSNAYSLDESKVVYVCGKNIVVYDLLTETQRVFQRNIK
mgnify:CR=1 FL=1